MLADFASQGRTETDSPCRKTKARADLIVSNIKLHKRGSLPLCFGGAPSTAAVVVSLFFLCRPGSHLPNDKNHRRAAI